MALRLSLLVACALLVGSCGASVTEVVLIIDGDLSTPTQVDTVEISVTSPNLAVQTASATFDDVSPGFPRTLGVQQKEDFDGEYSVEAVARKNGLLVVRRRARFRFVEGERRMLRITLRSECRGVLCTGDTTCGAGAFCERPVQSTLPFDADAIASEFDGGM